MQTPSEVVFLLRQSEENLICTPDKHLSSLCFIITTDLQPKNVFETTCPETANPWYGSGSVLHHLHAVSEAYYRIIQTTNLLGPHSQKWKPLFGYMGICPDNDFNARILWWVALQRIGIHGLPTILENQKIQCY